MVDARKTQDQDRLRNESGLARAKRLTENDFRQLDRLQLGLHIPGSNDQQPAVAFAFLL
jgi:hypothetical protein